jgi:hypothetical protein
MNEILYGIFQWIEQDYHSHRVRFVLEVLAWLMSVGCSLTMALTVPNPPLKLLYIPWIISTLLYAGCAYTRRSFGMLANYALLFTFDSIAFAKFWFV